MTHTLASVPDTPSAADVVDHINRTVLGTQLPYRSTSFGKSGSTIVAVRFADPALDYFIKFKRPQPQYGSTLESTRASLTREHRTLQHLSQAAPSTFELPRPLYFDSEHLILATSAVPGTPFLRKYRLAPRLGVTGRTSLTSDLHSIGRALSDFHRLPVSPDLEATRFTQRIALSSYASRLEHFAVRERPRLHQAAAAYLAELEGASPSDLDTVLAHNDLGLHNVLCGERPGLLDLDSVRPGPPEMDLAQLILSLVDFTMPGPVSGLRRQSLIRAVRTLLEGYDAQARGLNLKPFLVRTGLQWVIDLELRRRLHDRSLRRLHDSLLLARQTEFLMYVLEDRPQVDFSV